MDYKFTVKFLEPVLEFLESLDQKTREKVLYNIWKSRSVNSNDLFKKLDGEIWEFKLCIISNTSDYLGFGINLINKRQL